MEIPSTQDLPGDELDFFHRHASQNHGLVCDVVLHDFVSSLPDWVAVIELGHHDLFKHQFLMD